MLKIVGARWPRTYLAGAFVALSAACGARTSLSSPSDALGASDTGRNDDYKVAFSVADQTTGTLFVNVWHSRTQQTVRLNHDGYVSPSLTFDGRFVALRPAASQVATVLVLDSIENELWTGTTTLVNDSGGAVPMATIRADGNRVAMNGATSLSAVGCIATLDEDGATSFVPPCDSTASLTTPSYSPDGSLLTAVRLGDLATIVEHDDGTALRTILDFQGDGSCLDPAFSFDGTRLACVRSVINDKQACKNSNYCYALWVVDLTTLARQEVTSLDAAEWQYPHFTPDGASLIAVKTTSGHQIERVDIATGLETILAAAKYLDFSTFPPIGVGRDED